MFSKVFIHRFVVYSEQKVLFDYANLGSLLSRVTFVCQTRIGSCMFNDNIPALVRQQLVSIPVVSEVPFLNKSMLEIILL